MKTENLAMQGARASNIMVLTDISRNIMILAPEMLHNFGSVLLRIMLWSYIYIWYGYVSVSSDIDDF